MKAHTVEKVCPNGASEIKAVFTSHGSAKEYLENHVGEFCTDGFDVAFIREACYGWVYKVSHPATREVGYFRVSSMEMRKN